MITPRSIYARFHIGYSRFAEDIEIMLGTKPGYYYEWTWKVISPLILCVSIQHSMNIQLSISQLWRGTQDIQVFALKVPTVSFRAKQNKKIQFNFVVNPSSKVMIMVV